MSLDFWTSKNYLPYQIHNFKVSMDLYAIKSEKFFKVDPQSNPGIQNYVSDESIVGQDIERISIPSHAIKSIDLPTLEISLEDISGNLSDGQAEARDPNYQEIVVTFYAVDTPHGNMLNLLPRIFHAYYLDFQVPTGGIQAEAKIPFQTIFDAEAVSPYPPYCINSVINVELFRGKMKGDVNFIENPEGRDYRIPVPDRRQSEDRRNIVYRSVSPTSFDLGQLNYTENGVVECTMTFRYNIPFTEAERATTIGAPPKTEVIDDPA